MALRRLRAGSYVQFLSRHSDVAGHDTGTSEECVDGEHFLCGGQGRGFVEDGHGGGGGDGHIGYRVGGGVGQIGLSCDAGRGGQGG